MLQRTIEGMGIKVRCNTITTRITTNNGSITYLGFKDGARLETDMVVVSAGIRPITEIAVASGWTCSV
jgi:nitrite reductase (NADH) large subunit